ncbi:hypothetical protein [Subtercola frigoramans]|uniref:Uncharacterized membrane protein HdeD (DUF308 family) n=1 Tax=Subtercola frigoramans TaxID=120298 RepID=A0ABS2L006_9MICO|nr:hypothetical protein [Subtercola frigoramans]MBM7470397.1 uncharacterized membrane protein HdeD (DUF308 family) [Subtercola frigoramans]
MSHQPAIVEGRSPYWGVPVARAVPAFVVGLYLAFNLNHSSQVGLFVFGAFAVTSALLVSLLSLRVMAPGVIRRLFVTQAIVGLAMGAAALVFNSGGVPFFLYIVTLYASLTGFLELYSGLRSRTAQSESERLSARDWIAVGSFTAILALVFLLLPLDIVTAVGLFGGYAVILGIFLVIGGLSLRWGHEPSNLTRLNQETTP